MEKIFSVVLVLAAGTASAQVRAVEQLKASAPSGVAISVPAVPSTQSTGQSSRAVGNGLAGVPGATVLDQVKSLFDQGVPATKKDLVGWHSGRHVRDNMPDLLYGSVLLAGEFTDESGRRAFKVTSSANDAQDYFDDLDAAQTAYLREKWAAVAPTGQEVVFPAAVTVSKTWAFRKTGGCVISAYGRAGGEPYEYAYYCKDVTPAGR